MLSGRPGAQELQNGPRHARAQLVALQHLQGFCEGAGVRGSRSRGDHVQGIADNVGDDQTEKGPACKSLCQPSSLDVAQMFADGVHLIDGGAAAVQEQVSSRVMPGAGAGRSAEPPPEKRQMPTSSGPAERARSRIRRAPSTPAAVG